LLLACCPGHRLAAAQWLLDEPFDSLAAWDDLSTATSWSGQPADGSAWQTDGGILGLNAAGIASVGDKPWDSADKSRSFTCIDRRFDTPLEHRGGTLVIELRVRWKVLNYTPYRGEWNRINLMLVHDYPEGGLDLTRDLRVSDFSDAWWGRPAYQLRLRSTDAADATSLLMYGGGNDAGGEFEIYSEGGPPLWWLPGFSSTAGGSSSNGGPSPGVGDPWPFNSWTESSTGLASEQWRRFRYVVAPDHQALYVDEDDDGAGWIRDGYMPLPEEAEAPATAPLYTYFEHFEGLRVYFRGRDDSAEIDALQAWFAENAPAAPTLHREAGAWLLRFPTLPGKVYTVERSTGLLAWDPVSAPHEGDGFEAEVEVEGEPGAARGFFRLDIADAPAR
jgi:hypothetical protein